MKNWMKPGTPAYYVEDREMTEVVIVKVSPTWTTISYAWSFGKGRIRTSELRKRDWLVPTSRDGVFR